MIKTQVFSRAKHGVKSVISIFCCSVSEGNIRLHFQTLIWSLIIIIQSDFCDLIIIISLSGIKLCIYIYIYIQCTPVKHSYYEIMIV